MARRHVIEIGEPKHGWRTVMYGKTLLGSIARIKGRYHYQAPSGESGSLSRQRDAIKKLEDFRIKAAVNVLRESPGRPVSNRHKVYSKTWVKWSRVARRLFNAMMDEMHPKMQSLTTHPDMPLVNKEHWEVLRWNAAFLAASNVNKLL